MSIEEIIREKKRKPHVSVIIPVYNAESVILTCLDSITADSSIDIEIICVNDGSTDSSGEILQRYAEKDNRITVLNQKNAGAGAARNNGLRIAKGEYLSFLDADDFFEPNMLSEMYIIASENDADICVCRSNQFIESSNSFEQLDYSIRRNLLPQREPFAGKDIKKDIFKAFVGWPWDKLFKASFIQNNGLLFQEQRTSNDLLFVFSAIARANRIITTDKIFAHHRRSSTGTLSVTREKSWHCFYDALMALKGQLVKWSVFDYFKQDFINYSLHFSLWNLNTLKKETFYKLYNMLKTEWFNALQISEHGCLYFYNFSEYRNYRYIMRHSADEYLLHIERMKRFREAIHKLLKRSK